VETFDEFMRAYAAPGRDHPMTVDVGDDADQWPSIIVRFGDKTALLHLIGLGAGSDDAFLCIDIHPAVGNVMARASVVGTEDGHRYAGFGGGTPGASHGRPATRLVSVLIGRQSVIHLRQAEL
jgi:hypothetical protein